MSARHELEAMGWACSLIDHGDIQAHDAEQRPYTVRDVELTAEKGDHRVVASYTVDSALLRVRPDGLSEEIERMWSNMMKVALK